MEKNDKKEGETVRLATLEDLKNINYGIHGFEAESILGPNMAVFLLPTELEGKEGSEPEKMLYIANRYEDDGVESSVIDIFTIEEAFNMWSRLGALLFGNLNKELEAWQADQGM